MQDENLFNSFQFSNAELERRRIQQESKIMYGDLADELNSTNNELNATRKTLRSDLNTTSNKLKSEINATTQKIEADINTFRKEVDVALKTVRDETDLSLLAIRSETDQALETINNKLEDVVRRITALEATNENEIGNLVYTMLDECPAGYIQVDGRDIANYPKLRDLLQSFELPDYSDKFLRADNSEDDREIGSFQDDATAVNGLFTAEGGYHVHGIPITDDGDRAHIHIGWANYVHAGDSSGRWGGSGTGVRTDANGKHRHELEGDDETRPKNVNHILCVKAK